MSDDHRDVRRWMDSTTATFFDALDRVDDAALAAPSALPDWTVGMIVSHVHFNAEALRRLLAWARTGVETPMYESREKRAAEISDGAARPPAELREMVRASAAAFAADYDGLDDDMLSNLVATAVGRIIPASETLWMRTREVAIHAVDLGVGVAFEDLPEGMLLRLSTEIVATRHAGGEGPAIAAWLAGRAPAPELGPWL